MGADTKPTFILYRRSEEEMNAMLAENTPEISAIMAKAANTMFSSEADAASAGAKAPSAAAIMPKAANTVVEAAAAGAGGRSAEDENAKMHSMIARLRARLNALKGTTKGGKGKKGKKRVTRRFRK
jgi:hypothetical protein